MMIDKLTTLFDGRDGGNGKGVTADKQGHVYDMRPPGGTGAYTDYLGTGDVMYFVVAVNNVDKGNGNETYVVRLVDGTAATSAGGVTAGKRTLATVTLDRDNASAKAFVTIPGGVKVNRFIGAEADVGGTSPSFDVTAFLTHLRPESGADEQYPDAISFTANA